MTLAVDEWLASRPRPEFHSEMFGGPSAAEVTAGIEAFAAGYVGRVAEITFYVVSRGAVAGVALEDGSQVACKFLPLSHDRLEVLEDCRRVQRTAFDSGLPVAEPLIGPVVWRSNACFVDAWRPAITPLDGGRTDVRRSMAQGLFDVTDALRVIDSDLLRTTRYALPRDAPDCIEPTVGEALAWSHAVLARADRPRVAGHFDWRTPNAVVGENGDLEAIYDWDSVVVDLEERIVGAAAAFFSVGYTTEFSSVPTPDEVGDFVQTYESARGAPFDADSRNLVAAGAVYKLAWQTREEHLLDPDGVKEHERGIRRAFRRFPMSDYVNAIRG